MIIKHRFQLAWRTRQQHNRGALMIDKHTRRGTVRIGQHFRVFNHHRLTRIALRHRHSKTLKTLSNLCEHNLVKQKPATKCARGDLARDVVFSWTKTAGGNHHFRATDSIFDCFFEAGIVVADNRFEFDFDTETIELFGEPETVGVGAIGRKQLRSNGDDFG